MRLNGVLDGQPVVKKRRGRRKNVEGMDLLFMNRSRVPAVPDQVSSCLLFLVEKQELSFTFGDFWRLLLFVHITIYTYLILLLFVSVLAVLSCNVKHCFVSPGASGVGWYWPGGHGCGPCAGLQPECQSGPRGH